MVRRDYIEDNDLDLSWEEFKAFILGLPDDYTPPAPAEREFKIYEMAMDIGIEMPHREYLTDSDIKLSTYRITHDVDDTTPFVVGVELFTTGEGGRPVTEENEDPDAPEKVITLSDMISKLQHAQEVLREAGLDGRAAIYDIQDDCQCCRERRGKQPKD